MRIRKYILATLITTLVFITSQLPTCAQSAGTGAKSFQNDQLSFDYILNWNIADKSDVEKQYFILTPANASVLIAVIVYRTAITTFDQFSAADQEITKPYLATLAQSLGTSNRSVKEDRGCMELPGGRRVQGVQIRGVYNNEPSTGEVYSFVKAGRFIKPCISKS